MKFVKMICEVVFDAYKGFTYGAYLIAVLLRTISNWIMKHLAGLDDISL